MPQARGDSPVTDVTDLERDDVEFFGDDEVTAAAASEAKRWATLLERLANT